MASTYSPKLRFELIGAGEQAGLWGTTTNKNVGQLIEQAIAGVTTVELDGLSGDYTLTALDGAPDQSRSAVIKCGYSVTPAVGAVNLIIPTQTKLYVVRNDIGQKLYVKTAAQTGGVELEDGEATLVFCDGTDAILGLETAAAGVLGVNGGGTGQSTFSAGFVKSPGGTGALTTASSINASSEITGTLPTANGGTGLTGFTSSNRAIYSTSSSALTAGTLPVAAGGTGLTSPGANGNVLTSNGTAWVSSTPTAIFVTGMIILWSGSIASVPSGWALCDGTSGTPDLRDRFVVGAGSTYAVAATGGSKDAIVVSHTHTVNDSGHAHAVLSQGRTTTTGALFHSTFTSTSTAALQDTTGSSITTNNGTSTRTTGITLNSTGSSGTNANLPPYYALAYIMKL